MQSTILFLFILLASTFAHTHAADDQSNLKVDKADWVDCTSFFVAGNYFILAFLVLDPFNTDSNTHEQVLNVAAKSAQECEGDDALNECKKVCYFDCLFIKKFVLFCF